MNEEKTLFLIPLLTIISQMSISKKISSLKEVVEN
jgi:hypothetical protein